MTELDLEPSVLFTWRIWQLFPSLLKYACASTDLNLPETQILCHLPAKKPSVAPCCPLCPICHLAPTAPWMTCPCRPNTQCLLQYQAFVHILLLNFVCLHFSAECQVSWRLGSCLMHFWPWGTGHNAVLGKAQEILISQLIPFKTRASFCPDKSKE